MSSLWTGVSQMFAQQTAFKDRESAFYHSKEQFLVQTLMIGSIIPHGAEAPAVTHCKCSVPLSSGFCPVICSPTPPCACSYNLIFLVFFYGAEARESCMFVFWLEWLLRVKAFVCSEKVSVISASHPWNQHQVPQIPVKNNSTAHRVLIRSSMSNLALDFQREMT